MPHDAVEGVIFKSAGVKLLGAFYLAPGDDPKPTVLLCHGIPGNEQNRDLLYALRDTNFNALLFHYRGCWGSEGHYSLPGTLDDIRAALDYLERCPFPVDKNRLALVGHSLGGLGVINVAARDERVRAVVALAALADPMREPCTSEMATEFAPFLTRITPNEIIAQWEALAEKHNPLNVVAQIAPRPLLLIHGAADFLPIQITRELFARAQEPKELLELAGADHFFSQCRQQVRSKLVSWLQEKL
jgi:pimeloyl-ACP methyl ester carboxylesterase